MSRRTVDTVLPFQDEVITVSYTGTQLRAVLENSVSQYPLLDGRFLQVSGVRFRFDPLLPPQHRIIPGSVYVEEGKEYVPLCVDGEKRYVVATKTYVFAGKDGFPVGDSKYVVNRFDESLPTMFIAYLRLLAADSNVPRVPIGGGGGVTTTRHSDENSGIGNGIVNGNGVDVTLNGNGQHAANVNRNGHAIVSSNGDGSVHPQVVEDDDDDDSEDDNYNDDEDRRSKNRTAERKLMAVLNPMREGRIVCENECADLIKYYNAPSHDHH